MDRHTRISIVVGVTVTLIGFLVAFVVAPIFVDVLTPEMPPMVSLESMFTRAAARSLTAKIATVSQLVIVFASLIGASALAYTLFVFARWFVRSAPVKSD